MAAAVTLAERGIPVTVFESAKQLGGRARGVRHSSQRSHADDTLAPPLQLSPVGGESNRPLRENGLILDNGQHILLGCYRETLRLIELVGGNIAAGFPAPAAAAHPAPALRTEGPAPARPAASAGRAAEREGLSLGAAPCRRTLHAGHAPHEIQAAARHQRARPAARPRAGRGADPPAVGADLHLRAEHPGATRPPRRCC